MVDEVVSLQIAVVTVSDTRTEETDRSGCCACSASRRGGSCALS